MRDTLGDEFVTACAAMKDEEYCDFQLRVPAWELEGLMQNV